MKAAIVESSKAGSQQLSLGNYAFDLAMGRGWQSQAVPGDMSAQVQALIETFGQTLPFGNLQTSNRGYAIIIQTGPDDFWVAGANLNIKFSSTLAATPMASAAAVQEGRFENGKWVVGRHLAGDDTGMGGDDRASLRLTSNPSILHVSLYSYH